MLIWAPLESHCDIQDAAKNHAVCGVVVVGRLKVVGSASKALFDAAFAMQQLEAENDAPHSKSGEVTKFCPPI